MKFTEFKKIIDNVEESKKLEYGTECRSYFHPKDTLLYLASIKNEENNIIKIPGYAMNRYEIKSPVVAIGENAFRECDYITDVILPDTIYRIHKGAFKGCKNLKRITISKKIEKIFEGTFEGCVSLKDVYYEGSREEWAEINIVHEKFEIEFGEFISGTPVHKIKDECMFHIPGNEAILMSNIHFNCSI